MAAAEAEQRALEPLAVIRAHATHAQEPAWFTTAPVAAINKVLDAAGWSADEVDLYEINEAFAVVTMAAMSDLGLDHAKVNVNGGACALGHPIGASGARIIVTLISALQRRGLKKGVAALCIGGGEATAIAHRTGLVTLMSLNDEQRLIRDTPARFRARANPALCRRLGSRQSFSTRAIAATGRAWPVRHVCTRGVGWQRHRLPVVCARHRGSGRGRWCAVDYPERQQFGGLRCVAVLRQRVSQTNLSAAAGSG